jgi:hypothetical protein
VATVLVVVDEIVPRSNGSALIGLLGVLVVIGIATRTIWTAPDTNQPE